MNHLHRLHVLLVSTLGMIVTGIGILGWAEVAHGQASYEELHAFVLDAAYPRAGLLQDNAGNLYGTTQSGGASDAGTVYKLEPSGTFTVLHSFDGSDGCGGGFPYLSLIQDSAVYGRASCRGGVGDGTVYKVEPKGSFTFVHSFNCSD